MSSSSIISNTADSKMSNGIELPEINEIKISKEEKDKENKESDILRQVESKIIEIKTQNEFETGDILLFSGKRNIISWIIELFTISAYSHVGIIIKNPSFIDAKIPDGYYLLESACEHVPDVTDGKCKLGVELVKLEDVMKYDEKRNLANIYHRRLNWHTRPANLNEQVKTIYEKVRNKPYDFIDLLRADLQIKIGDCRKTNSFFCSALVAYIYSCLGLLDPKTTDWDLYEPKHFCSKYLNQLCNSCSLDKENQIL